MSKHVFDNIISDVATKLASYNYDNFINSQTLGIKGRELLYQNIDKLKSILFPSFFKEEKNRILNLDIYIGNLLREVYVDMVELIEKALFNSCSKFNSECDQNKCSNKACEIIQNLINDLPSLREILQKDIEAAYNGDPAALSNEEIVLSYPTMEALIIHRLAHNLYEQEVPLIPRIMSELAHQKTGIDIHPGATIGNYFFVDHGTGVVIGETCTIGDNVKLYQGVTLGAKSFSLDENGNPIKGVKRHPNIGNGVIVYSGATILGGDTYIGDNCVIGGNVWLTESVEANSLVYYSEKSTKIKKLK